MSAATLRTAVVSVVYREPDWAWTTRPALDALPCPVTYVDRAGTGSLALAHNRGFLQARRDFPMAPYVWFVTNVTFAPDLLVRLERVLDEDPTLAAVHPTFQSDHAFCRPDGSGAVRSGVPFVEFTAPLVRTDVFVSHPLDVRMPYWGHDLDWGHRVRRAGWRLAVHHGAEVGHQYIRHSLEHPVTRERHRLRKASDPLTEKALRTKYGREWRKVLAYR